MIAAAERIARGAGLAPVARIAFVAWCALAACGEVRSQGRLEWSWQYRGPGVAGESIVAGGRLFTDPAPDADGWFAIRSISGLRNGVRIASLVPAGDSIPGNVNASTGVPYAWDNLIRESGSAPGGQLDKHGLQFSLDDGTYSNVFFASFLDPPTHLDFHSVPPFPAGPVPPNSEEPVFFSATPVQRSAPVPEANASGS